nr:hypothetical protein [Tanacetum cinerariifolium]
MERFKVETRRMKGAHECMWISDFMHGVNNPELTKRLNEDVQKTMKEMMITTTVFIRGEAAATGKKKGHTSWRTHDQSKWHTSEKRFDFRGQPRKGRGLEGLPPLQGHQKKFSWPRQESSSRHHLCRLKSWCEQASSRIELKKLSRDGISQREITFPSLATSSGTEGPLVIEAKIGGHMIHRMYVNEGSSTEALGNNRRRRSFYKSMDEFHDCKALSPYNDIIGRLRIKEIQAVPSAAHRMLKFPADRGILTIRSTILVPAECATVITSSKEIPKEASVRYENFKVALHPNFPDQEVAIEGTLSEYRESVAEHRLNIREGYLPVRQKKRGQALKRAKAIQAEVQKLVEAGIMREVYYHKWLSNPVMVKKHDGSWRMCIDFTDLKKACPQDCYPLLEIDWKVESLCGYPFKCFLNAYKGYHQIHLAESDEEKTTFHIGQGVYCYTKMPFGLKNAGATYQRLVDKAFDSQMEQAFKQLKQNLSKLPLLVAPKPKEELIVYLFASYGAISAVLMTEMETVQTPVYFVSRTLQGPKLNYTPMKKLVLSLVFVAKRLQRYLQAYPVAVLADFLAEMPDESPLDASVVETQQEPCTLFTNGSSSSNNEAEYEALIAGLRIVAHMRVENVHVSVDSKLVANQVLGAYGAKDENMIKCPEKVKILVSGFANFSINQVPRSKNKKVDALSKNASTRNEASKLRIKARQYELLKGVLYRRSFLTPWLRCVGPLQADYVIQEIHEGSWSMHAGPRSVVAKAIRLGNDASLAVDRGKLGPTWEGPYEVTKALGDRACKLRSADETVLPRTWNVANLKKCYL